uniref:Protein FAM117B n=1 Tax=Cacopsylla melanoneura TaxID=428564 RepID=A0A8D9EDI1_9HEMI
MAQTTSPTISKCSPRPQPLKAFLPITSVTKDASGVNWKSESNSPSLLSPTIGWKSGLRSPGASSRGYSKLSYADPLSLKRTASFDTIYLQPSFNHKNHYVYGNAHTMLCIDKSTQTIDGGSRFKHDSVSKLDKFFRHRFQRKDSSNSSSISGSTPTEHITTQTCPLTPVHRVGTIRNSVEGLNQEIERLVLRNTSVLNIEREEDKDISEGHRAPLAEILGLIRSVNTQTPGENFTPSSLSSSGPPSRGDVESPLGARPLAFSRPASEDSSPGAGDPGSKSGASPKINKFLAREPPDGCERVNLKFIEDQRKPMCDLSLLEDYPPLKPSLTFTLRPSTGSAFYTPSSDAILAPSAAEQGTSESNSEPTSSEK